jgi:hypothetical protein
MHKPPQAAVSVVVPTLHHGRPLHERGRSLLECMHGAMHMYVCCGDDRARPSSHCPHNSWLRLGAVPAVAAAYGPVEPARRAPATPGSRAE